MDKQYQIEKMSKAELQTAIKWAAQEGWNPGLFDFECFYATDPTGFFAGKLNGKTIAVGSAVLYDDAFAFCGFYIVDKNYRGQGFGFELTQHRLNTLGHRNAGIDGVINMLDKYARIGYKLAHYNARYAFRGFQPHPDSVLSPAIVSLLSVPFSDLITFDRIYFPAPREHFLSCWINQPKSRCLGYVEAGNLKGYGVIRACEEGYKIGPLFAENENIADALFLQLARHAKGKTIYLDIPENNPYAIQLVNRYGADKIFATARMYLKDEPKLPIQQIFGITTFELG